MRERKTISDSGHQGDGWRYDAAGGQNQPDKENGLGIQLFLQFPVSWAIVRKSKRKFLSRIAPAYTCHKRARHDRPYSDVLRQS
jgi:hypothetical protein